MNPHQYAEFVVTRVHGSQQPGPSWMSRATMRRLGLASAALEAYWQRWDERMAARTERG